MRYSGFKVIKEGLFGNTGWKPAWRDPAPKAEYDAIIIGGGGHGLSTAYYLAKNHGITNVAVLEKGYLGSGNIGRNTTIVRANYFLPGNSEFYSHSLKLWEGLESDLNYSGG
jgi:methylglutamate dehydrogenase subunit A